MKQELNIFLLDATLRDGGQGLEDGYKNGFYDAQFGMEFISDTIDKLVESNMDIIELGAMGPSEDDKSMFAIYQNIEDLSKTLPKKRNPKQMYVGLYIGPDTDVNRIPEWNPNLVEGVRVILRYSELKKSIEYCAALSKKGYKVFVQPMLTMRYTNEELDYLLAASNDMEAFAVYFVDSYGYMMPRDIDRFFDYYDNRLKDGIHMGFHAHNNMNMAFANVQHFLSKQTNRTLISDSCVLGIGQGAGNLQTEVVVPYLNSHYGKNYGYDSVLDLCEKYEDRFLHDNEWGYSTMRLLPAVHHAAYKYGVVLRKRFGMSLREINAFLTWMPEWDKQRYTETRLNELLKEFANR
jgi:4-hydroxy 2-oxovalerate aldolase